MTRRVECWEVFLSGGGFPERGTGGPDAVAAVGLTVSVSQSSCHDFHTFAGQCCQPLCPGDAANHVDRPGIVTKSRSLKGRIGTSGLRPAWERGPPPPPKRDASRTLFTWPLRRRLLPPDAGCVPRPRPGSSEDFRTGLDLPE